MPLQLVVVKPSGGNDAAVELRRLFSVLAADEQEQRLPPGIAARAARLAELAGVLGETAGLLQGPAVAAHSGDDVESSEASEPPPTGSGNGFASRIKTGVRTQGTRLTQRRHGSFSRASGRRPWEGTSVEESSDVAVAAAQFHSAFTANAEPPNSCTSSPPDAARARARARALGEVHAQTAESEQESEEELDPEPERPLISSSGRSGFASRIKTNVQTQGTRLNIRRQGSFSRMPVIMGRANAEIADGYSIDGYSTGALSAEQAAVAFQAAFQADGRIKANTAGV